MKILLIHPNKFAHRYISVGISMISAVLKQAGHEVLFFDTSRFIENDSADYSDGSFRKMEQVLLYSTLMEAIGGERIIGVDTYIPDSLKKRLASHGRLFKRLILIKGSSTGCDTLAKIKSIVGNCRKVMVVLDSYHTHEHVLKELRLYSSLVGKGFYIICGDTIIEDMPEQKVRPRPWGPGNNPKTALSQFLKENTRFEADKLIENKLLFTCNPGGYLRCCRET